MPQYRITLRIEGADPGEENVRLSDFLQELNALRNVLRKTEEVVAGRSVLDWQIVDLSHNSPAMVAVEPVFAQELVAVEPVFDPTQEVDRRAEVVGGFFKYLRSLSASEAPPELDRAALEAFRELAAPIRQHKIRATISNGVEPVVEVNPAIENTIVAVLAPTMKALGTVKGRLEFLNIHAAQNVFRIYSPLVPRWVTCHFPEHHLQTAKEAVGRKVRVSGQVTYQTRDPYPQSIEVEQIEILPEDSELPRLLELRGIAPEATGDLLSEDFVRAMRGDE